MSNDQPFANERLAEIDAGLACVNEAWMDWQQLPPSIRRVDYRDLLICLGALWLSAEEAGIAPARRFSSVARISNHEPVYGNRSTRDLFRGFRTSAHLKSIKRKRAAC